MERGLNDMTELTLGWILLDIFRGLARNPALNMKIYAQDQKSLQNENEIIGC